MSCKLQQRLCSDLHAAVLQAGLSIHRYHLRARAVLISVAQPCSSALAATDVELVRTLSIASFLVGVRHN